MIYILLFFIGASLLLYVVLGGADYGAGILELLHSGKFREKQKHLINHAMGPVWEANHMWLIIVVVILFMGFPKVFLTLMTSLHIPMVALLIGIVVRGAVFTFRHYDPIQEPRSQKLYTVLFGLSSLWTSLWLGIIAGSIFHGDINTTSTNFAEAYVLPWLGAFQLAMGLFVVSIFSYLASIYLIGETDDPAMKRYFLRRAFTLNVCVILNGGLVFLASYLEQGNLVGRFFENPLALICLVSATLFFAVLWSVAKSKRTYLLRVLAAGQISFILFGWYSIYAPNALLDKAGSLTFFEAAAPDATLKQLTIALVIGSAFIFPSLFYLLKVFKWKAEPQ